MFTCEVEGVSMTFETHPSLFSPKGLDAGTRAMLSCVAFSPSDRVLDLGCGYGPVGIYAARQIGGNRVAMADVDALAVDTAQKNAHINGVPDVRVIRSDGFRQIDGRYTLILCNPPYHVDFSVPKHFIEEGFRRLAAGGRFVMVTKRREWYKQKLISVFGGVRIRDVDGYFVFTAEKRSDSFAGR